MAEGFDHKKQLENPLVSIQKALQCPVCLDTLKVPFKVCARGHGVCSECARGMENCPTCRQWFTQNNPICLKNVIEALRRLCKYSEAGCNVMVESGDDHEMYCGYRPVRCKAYLCDADVQVRQLLEHYETVHPIKVLVKSETQSEPLSLYTFKMHLLNYIPVWLFENWFWLFVFYRCYTEELKLAFLGVPIGKVKDNFFCTVKVKIGNFLYAHTMKVFCLSGPGSHDLNADNKHCLKIPRDLWDDRAGDGTLEVHVFREPL